LGRRACPAAKAPVERLAVLEAEEISEFDHIALARGDRTHGDIASYVVEQPAEGLPFCGKAALQRALTHAEVRRDGGERGVISLHHAPELRAHSRGDAA